MTARQRPSNRRSHLTAPDPELARLIRQTPPESMMHWSGTCADPTAVCGGCRHFGYETVARNDAGDAVVTHKFSTRCALYRKYTGRHGKPFNQNTPACKYFQAK
jgi:hypothetical protein